ncbi:MAG: NAD-dependent epimerase/dehydratase family protein [bacterium]|nr:NAD-dependent epimerase/dehydratase family protein [bacterium]
MKTRPTREKKFVLVDGAAGYLGRHLVESFISHGYRVRATDLKAGELAYAEKLGAEVLGSDLLDPASLKRVAKGVDWAVHSAAAFDLGLPYSTLKRVNVDGTENICRALTEQKVKKLLHISTGGVYGPPIVTPTREDHPINPVDGYSRSKYQAELVLERYRKQKGLYSILFRPTALYGPGGKYIASAFMTLPIIALEYRLRSLPLLSGGQRLNMVHVKDVAEAAVHVLGQENISSGEVFNLADCDIMSAAEFFAAFYRAFGIQPGRKINIPPFIFDKSVALIGVFSGPRTLAPLNRWLEQAWRQIVNKYHLEPILTPHVVRDDLYYFGGNHAYDASKLIHTGYHFLYPGFAEGFAETVKWYQEQRWIPNLAEIGRK